MNEIQELFDIYMKSVNDSKETRMERWSAYKDAVRRDMVERYPSFKVIVDDDLS